MNAAATADFLMWILLLRVFAHIIAEKNGRNYGFVQKTTAVLPIHKAP
jgi:hypothetical protein